MSSLLRRLHVETFVLNLRDPLDAAPSARGYAATLDRRPTLEIEVSKEQNLNDMFARLSALGIEVLSMRNKVNRLEEIFMRLVEGRGARGARPRPHPAPRDGGAGTGAAAGRGAPMSSVALPDGTPDQLDVVRWIGFKTIVIREYGRIIRIWGQTIVPLGGDRDAVFRHLRQPHRPARRLRWAASTTCQYIAPGLIMMAVITNSYGNVVSSFFGAKFGKHMEEMLVSPLPNWLIVAGYAAAGWCGGCWSARR